MDRDLEIHYHNSYFGNLTFYYEEYFHGNVFAQRKELQEITFESTTSRKFIDIYSKLDRFEHPKIDLIGLLELDRNYVFSCFGKEIDDNKLDRNAFSFHYSDYWNFSRFLFNNQREVIGKLKIIVNSVEQTKVLLFEPFDTKLEVLRQQVQEPFIKINTHILSEFFNDKITNLDPGSYYR